MSVKVQIGALQGNFLVVGWKKKVVCTRVYLLLHQIMEMHTGEKELYNGSIQKG